LISAPLFYPSSKTCSGCGAVKQDLSLAERIYACSSCGLKLDRDRNAALNLALLAQVAASSTETSKTPDGGAGRPAPCRRASMKQELNSRCGAVTNA